MTLTEFLLARIAEDEQVARAATDGPWRVDSERYAEAIYSDGLPGAAVVAGGRWGDEASVFDSTEDALHIARHDPARVLAECEAKRRIIEAHKIEGRSASVWHDRADGLRQLIEATEYTCSVCGWVGEDSLDGAGTTGCDTLRALALPYADHPDYRQKWRP